MIKTIVDYFSFLKNNKLSLSLLSLLTAISLTSVFLLLKLQNDFFIPLWLVIFLYVISVSLLLMSSIRLEWVVFLAIVFLGFVRWEPAPVDIIMPILLIFLLLKTKNIEKIKEPFIIHFFIFLFVITNFTALQNILSFKDAAKYGAISLLLVTVFYFIKLFVNNEEKLILIARAYILSAFIAVISGLAGIFGIFPDIVLFGGRFWGNFFRLQGFFKDPNVFGPFLIPAILIIIESFFDKKLLRLSRPIKAFLLIMISTGLLFSFSRAAMLNMFVALIIYIGLNMKRGQFIKTVSIVLSAVVIIYLSVIFVSSNSLIPLDTKQISLLETRHYDTQRFSTQKFALITGYNNPFGLGPGQFDLYSKTATHELYLRLLVEQGILGLIGFVGLMCFIIFKLLKWGLPANKTISSMQTIIISLLGGIIINSFFIDTLHWRHFWLLLALGWAVIDIKKTYVRSGGIVTIESITNIR